MYSKIYKTYIFLFSFKVGRLKYSQETPLLVLQIRPQCFLDKASMHLRKMPVFVGLG